MNFDVLFHGDNLRYVELLIRMVVAAVCGALVGVERSRRFKEAGIRTYCLVALASATLMIVSKYGFADLPIDSIGTKGADPSRIASQIVSGIGFLGAGAIFRNGSAVRGLTTAAGIWAMAAVGMAIGSGMYVLGIFMTLLLLAVQFILHRVRVGGDMMATYSITVTVNNPSGFEADMKVKLAEWGALIDEYSVNKKAEGINTYTYLLKLNHKQTDDDRREFFDSREDIVFFNFKRL